MRAGGTLVDKIEKINENFKSVISIIGHDYEETDTLIQTIYANFFIQTTRMEWI